MDARSEMATSKPHYLLFCDGCLLPSGAMHTEARGRWRFVLEDIVTGTKIEASDCEASDHVDRVSLLAVTRGLEALEQPSRVTLVTTSRYVARGLQYGLVEWRENDYCWEHFGSIQPIRNADLWRRVDVALRFHEVQCRWMSQESPLRDEPAVAASITEIPQEIPAVHALMDTHEINETESHDSCPSSNGCPIAVVEQETNCPSSARVGSIYRATPETSNQDEAPTLVLSRSDTVGSSPRNAGVYPLQERRLLNMRVNRPIRWIWNTILALDGFLVSCLRCLFLLDPRREHFRRRDY